MNRRNTESYRDCIDWNVIGRRSCIYDICSTGCGVCPLLPQQKQWQSEREAAARAQAFRLPVADCLVACNEEVAQEAAAQQEQVSENETPVVESRICRHLPLRR